MKHLWRFLKSRKPRLFQVSWPETFLVQVVHDRTGQASIETIEAALGFLIQEVGVPCATRSVMVTMIWETFRTRS